jgi:hypothetical protein
MMAKAGEQVVSTPPKLRNSLISWLEGGLGVAWGWLEGGSLLPSIWLVDGSKVA